MLCEESKTPMFERTRQTNLSHAHQVAEQYRRQESTKERVIRIKAEAHDFAMSGTTTAVAAIKTEKRTHENVSALGIASKKPRREVLVPVKIESGAIDLTNDTSSEVAFNQKISTESYTSPTLLEVYEPDLLDIGRHESGHIKIDRSQEQCIRLLEKAREFINRPQLHRFCSPTQRIEWNNEIDGMMNQQEPEIVIGCLGGTGVGKSSLLKALLNEDNILPTSSSRGCTAAVVELKFNLEFRKPQVQVAVYKGEIEFIALQDWKDELKLLMDDCCDDKKKVSSHRIGECEDIEASWKKIDSVYGFGTMVSHDGKTKDEVYKTLSEDPRVIALLGSASEGACNLIEVTEGEVTASESIKLLDFMRDPNKTIDKKLVREKKKWVNAFRRRINSYVYRKGNGKDPQTWPLIRKVVLHGPWNVLSTGVCLVDLPGVGDDNAARAKVAEKYLQNCNKLWIFAPIKRAVDDKIAKDLLGKEFKRRLLMDGNYSNVSFICTHSDDCEISEIMHDHEDVAKEEPGRWARMVSLRETINFLAKTDDDLEEEMEDIRERILTTSNSDQALIKALKESDEKLIEEVNRRQEINEDSRSARRKECHKKLKVCPGATGPNSGAPCPGVSWIGRIGGIDR